MINKRAFNKNRKDCFCENPELIENYDRAITDTSQTWVCHHRLEEFCTISELMEIERYFFVKPEDLIFLTRKDHSILHGNMQWKKELQSEIMVNTNKKNKGKKLSEKQKRKISESCKGRQAWNKGKKCSNISESCKGRIPWNKGKRKSELEGEQE